MTTRRYEVSMKDCQCSQILKIAEAFIDPPWKVGLKTPEWCILLHKLMREFDSRFKLNNGDWFEQCICPKCGAIVCDWCMNLQEGD